MASWRAPGSILEALGLDFGGSWVDFSKIFGKNNHKRQKPAKKGHRSIKPRPGHSSRMKKLEAIEHFNISTKGSTESWP